jgi:hypothetical protein
MMKILKITFLLLAINQIAIGQSNKDLYRDSIRNLIVGEWNYEKESHEMKLDKHLNYYEEIPDFAKKKLKRIAGMEITDSLKIQFTEDDKFIISNSDKNKIEYRLSIYKERFWISRSDYVITLYYKLDKKGKLILTNKPRVGESKIKLVKNKSKD